MEDFSSGNDCSSYVDGGSEVDDAGTGTNDDYGWRGDVDDDGSVVHDSFSYECSAGAVRVVVCCDVRSFCVGCFRLADVP